MNVADGIMAMSAPPGPGGGAMVRTRGASVRRRLMSPEEPSPHAKRPQEYMQPGVTPLVGAYTNQQLTNESIQQKNAIEAMHNWVKSIANAVTQHASLLDAADIESGTTKGKIAQYERTMSKGLLGAEQQLTATFAKMDAIVGQLRGETGAAATALAARAQQLEEGMAALQKMVPPGLQQPAVP